MIVTLKWLGDYVNLEGISIKDIVDKFINIGFEVEEVRDLSRGMERVKIGRIEHLSKHPNADKLQICDINIGNDEHVQILTAATNVFEGALVPCALDGANLPNGVKINTTNMRGELSMGMLCSGEELVINDSIYPTASVDGIMILDESAQIGEGIAEFLGLDDVVLDIKVLANRPDCQSVRGLAKELAVGLGREFHDHNIFSGGTAPDLPLEVEVQTELCPVYFTAIIRDACIKDSIDVIRRRLRAIGIKPKNNAVDLTNYVLWDTGQPIHAFDYDKIKNHKIFVRKARQGESIIGLDGKEYALSPEMVIIADDSQPIGIAGVMGGRDFSVNENTNTLVIESAVYDRVSIRRTARAMGLRTDASGRFERGVQTISAELGLDLTLELAEKIGLGKVCKTIQMVGKVDKECRTVEVKLSEVSATLGIEIPAQTMIDILNSLDIKTSLVNDVLVCSVPPIRADISRPADIIEEIIRIYGFGHITPTYCEHTQSIAGGMDSQQKLEYELLDYCLSTGAYQVRTYGFRSPHELDKLLIPNDDALRNCVKIQNPLSLDYSLMRTQMLGSLLGVASFNESHQNFDIKICEIGKVFLNDRTESKPIPTENKILCYLATGKTDFFELKSLAELIASRLNTNFNYVSSKKCYMHPNICADIMLGNKVIGCIGKVHPLVTKNFDIKSDCYYLEINTNLLPAKKFKKIKPLPKFPAAYRDLAIVVSNETLVGNIIQVIKKAGGNLLESVELFDIYSGEQVEAGFKSVAFNLTFRKAEGTLTQIEVNELFENIVAQLEQKFSAKLRA